MFIWNRFQGNRRSILPTSIVKPALMSLFKAFPCSCDSQPVGHPLRYGKNCSVLRTHPSFGPFLDTLTRKEHLIASAQMGPVCLIVLSTLFHSACVSVPLSTSNAIFALFWSSASVKAFESPHIIKFPYISDSLGGGGVQLWGYPANKTSLTPLRNQGNPSRSNERWLRFSNPVPTLIAPPWPVARRWPLRDPFSCLIRLFMSEGKERWPRIKNYLHGWTGRCCQVFANTHRPHTAPAGWVSYVTDLVMCGTPLQVQQNQPCVRKRNGLYQSLWKHAAESYRQPVTKHAPMPILFTAQAAMTRFDPMPQINPCFGSHPRNRTN